MPVVSAAASPEVVDSRRRKGRQHMLELHLKARGAIGSRPEVWLRGASTSYAKKPAESGHVWTAV
eukprot:7377840-Prymnesium_polylepis.1